MIGVGVIGYGYWGPNLVRNFSEVPSTRVVSVADLRAERLQLVKARYPTLETVTDHRALITNPKVDAVVIATPASTHFDMALQAIQAGKHVLLGKPAASTSEEALQIIDEANRRNVVLMVDHTFVYTGAVRRIKELVDKQHIGDLYYYDSVRVNLGLFQHDVNVLWDLAVHDLSIMDYVLGETPTAIAAIGMSHFPGNPQDVAYLTLFFDTNLLAHFHVNWLAPVKVRRTLIGGSRKMIVYDDLEPSEKVKVYDKGITVKNHSEGAYQVLIDYRTGDMWAPQLDTTEALRTEAIHFIRCIEHGDHPITDGEAGLRVVRILEAAAYSMAERGRPVELDRGRMTAD